ncbi:hypothetical protein ACF0H5_003307 [Mactra antiquata]
MEVEFVWIIFFVFITILKQEVLSYKTYEAECGETIKLDPLNPAAKLVVTDEDDCYVNVSTEPGYQIAYTLDNPGIYKPTSPCAFSVSFDDFVLNNTFCFDSPMISHDSITANEGLRVDILGDADNVPSFNIMFVSVRTPSCQGSEVICSSIFGSSRIPEVCLQYTLLCHQTYPYCTDNNQACSDISTDNPANFSYTYIIAGIAGLFVLGSAVLMAIFRYKKHTQAFHAGRSTLRDVRTHAMAIFSTQLTARGVDSADGNVTHLDVEGNPIDLNKFEPPPEYSSLEHIDSVGVTNAGMFLDEEEPPPAYDHVMKNHNDFSITTNV